MGTKRTGDPASGARIRKARKALGMDPDELGNRVERVGGYISQLELGYNDPQTKLWIKLAVELGESLDFLMRGTRDVKPGPLEKRTAEAIGQVGLETIELLAAAAPEVLDAVMALLRVAESSRNQVQIAHEG